MKASAKLKKYEGAWKEAKGEQNKAFERTPDGKYRSLSVGVNIGESKGSGRLQVDWDFRITKGNHINSHAHAYDSLEDDRGLSAIKGRLKALGGKVPASLSKLPEALESVLDVPCLIKLETRKGKTDFQTLTILKRIKKSSEASEDKVTSEGLES